MTQILAEAPTPGVGRSVHGTVGTAVVVDFPWVSAGILRRPRHDDPRRIRSLLLTLPGTSSSRAIHPLDSFAPILRATYSHI